MRLWPILRNSILGLLLAQQVVAWPTVNLGGGASGAVVVFQAASGGNTSTTGGVTSMSWSHTVAPGTNLALFCGLAIRCTNNCTGGAVTFNGDAMAAHADVLHSSGVLRVYLFRLANPDVATGTVAASWTGSEMAAGGCGSFTGVHQATPLGTIDTDDAASGTSVTCTSTVPANGILLGVAGKRNDSEALVSATGIEMWNTGDPTATASAVRQSAGLRLATAGAQNAQFTSSANREMLCISAAINPA